MIHVPQSGVPGHLSYDILVNGTGQFLGMDMRVGLTSGSLFQDALGSLTPPDPIFFSTAPTLAFDTFVGMGGRTSDTTLPFILIDNTLPFPGLGPLDVAWAPANMAVSDPVDFFVARLTLSNDAAGEIRLRHLALGGTPDFEQTISIPIAIADPVPEPSSIAVSSLALLTGAALLRRPPVKP